MSSQRGSWLNRLCKVYSDELPAHALLYRYRLEGAFTDCYVTTIDSRIPQDRYIAAFYTTALFKLERWLIRWLAGHPSTDAGALQLATGKTDAFAVWTVEARDDRQLLLQDLNQHTRSWLMTEEIAHTDGTATRLYFGSAIVPQRSADGSEPRRSRLFTSLLGFHKLYSILLLFSARRRLQSRTRP